MPELCHKGKGAEPQAAAHQRDDNPELLLPYSFVLLVLGQRLTTDCSKDVNILASPLSFPSVSITWPADMPQSDLELHSSPAVLREL